MIGNDTRFVKSTGSTMDDVTLLATTGAAEGLVISADEQTAGRGRYDRRWVSAPGEDLLFSVLFRPRPAIAVEVNMAVTLAIAELVDRECGVKAAIKWPNDVRVNGAKIAGVLLESLQGADGLTVVSGIGLNVNSRMSGVNPGGTVAVSMSDLTGTKHNRRELLEALLDQINSHYAPVKAGNTLVPAWRERIETIGMRVDVTFTSASALSEVISGVAEDVDESGRLIVRDGNDRVWRVAAGEVTLHGESSR